MIDSLLGAEDGLALTMHGHTGASSLTRSSENAALGSHPYQAFAAYGPPLER